MVRETCEAIRKMSEYEKAKLRVSLRQHYNLPGSSGTGTRELMDGFISRYWNVDDLAWLWSLGIVPDVGGDIRRVAVMDNRVYGVRFKYCEDQDSAVAWATDNLTAADECFLIHDVHVFESIHGKRR